MLVFDWLAAIGVGCAWKTKRQLRERTQALRQATDAIRANEQVLSRILEALPLALFGKDPNDHFRYALFNSKAEQVFGLSRDQVLGRTDFEIFSEERAEGYWELDQKLMDRGGMVAVPVPERITSAQGCVHLHTLKVPIFDAEGRPRLVLGITEDITGRMLMEEELRKSRESLAKAQALAGIGNWDWDLAMAKCSGPTRCTASWAWSRRRWRPPCGRSWSAPTRRTGPVLAAPCAGS